MKYAIIIPDGCADLPLESLGGRTPMQTAHTPNLDALAQSGIVGRSNNVPSNLFPGSDVATLGLLGYDPSHYYTGRAPLEAVAQGIALGSDDWAIRCNLVTVTDGLMKSFAAGHIATNEAAELMQSLNESDINYLNIPDMRGLARFFTNPLKKSLVPIPQKFIERSSNLKQSPLWSLAD